MCQSCLAPTHLHVLHNCRSNLRGKLRTLNMFLGSGSAHSSHWCLHAVQCTARRSNSGRRIDCLEEQSRQQTGCSPHVLQSFVDFITHASAPLCRALPAHGCIPSKAIWQTYSSWHRGHGHAAVCHDGMNETLKSAQQLSSSTSCAPYGHNGLKQKLRAIISRTLVYA